MRKESGFEVTDRIVIYYNTDAQEIKEIMECGAIAKDVLADKVVCESRGKEWNINGLAVRLDVERV